MAGVTTPDDGVGAVYFRPGRFGINSRAMSERLIEFHQVGTAPYPKPTRAADVVQDWLKNWSTDPHDLRPGVVGAPRRHAALRAASLGFNIPLVYETRFQFDAGGKLTVTTGELPVESQFQEQVRGSPLEGYTIAKFINPWIVKTPAEWSCLLTASLNHYHIPFEVLPGMVETDTYYRQVLFPTLCGMRRGQSAVLAPGTPLVQAIPIRREAWKSRVAYAGTERLPIGADERVIEFAADSPDVQPSPGPAIKFLPEWLRRMPNLAVSTDGTRESQTVKKCPPFLEAVTMGYLIPLTYDVELTCSASGEVDYRSNGPAIDARFPIDVRGTPFDRMIVLRFHNPWRLKTPPGYSTLVLPMLGRYELPMTVVPGLIDTDTDDGEVFVPMIVGMRPGQRLTLARGTALAQVVPVSRGPWRHECGTYDEDRREAAEVEFEKDPHHYKNAHWAKKSYS